jgi:hypothetical protein
MLFYALQTPVLCLSSSDGFHLDVVKIKETDRDGLLVTSVGRGLACNWTLCTQTTHWQCAAVRNKWGLKKIRCWIGKGGHLIACHAGSVANGVISESKLSTATSLTRPQMLHSIM